MEKFSSFFADNYVWIIGIALFILFTLIGFFADMSRKKRTKQLQEQAIGLDKKQEELKKIAEINKPIDESLNIENTNQNIVVPEESLMESRKEEDLSKTEEIKVDIPIEKNESQFSKSEEPLIKDEFDSPTDETKKEKTEEKK